MFQSMITNEPKFIENPIRTEPYSMIVLFFTIGLTILCGSFPHYRKDSHGWRAAGNTCVLDGPVILIFLVIPQLKSGEQEIYLP